MAGEKLNHRYIEAVGNLDKVVDRDVLLASFKLVDMRSIHFKHAGKF